MNEGLNPIDLIFDASPAVQLVFLILLTLSIVSWVIIVQRWLVLSAAQKGVLSFEQRFWSGVDLSQLYKVVSFDSGVAAGGWVYVCVVFFDHCICCEDII